jgi:hypothetical protein
MHKDLSETENSVTFWLGKNINEINAIYRNKEKLIEFLKTIKNDPNIKVSDEWFNKFLYRIQRQKNCNETLKYIYNIYLAGCNLSTKDKIFGDKYENEE